ncbi:MAG TPA: HNH endonuclease, partial [Bryocella sp.]|nr:HNH endonuclease [Bryocella sp.]
MSISAHSAASRYGKSLAGCMHHARMTGDEPPHWAAMHAPVLVLNASYEPINVCAARRAIILVLKGVAMMEEANGHVLHAARVAMRVPSVIRLLEYRRIPHQTRALSRKNILLRDRNTCQYCGKALAAGELTLDHVIPRSRG